jgi:hypothetical protein
MSGSKTARGAQALVVFGLLACGGDERPKAEPMPNLRSASAAKPADGPHPTTDELPVPEDFEAEAEREISRENLRAQLDAIEREIKADKR